jgi:hypothetical protein
MGTPQEARTAGPGSASIAAHLEAHYRSRPTKDLVRLRQAFLLVGDGPVSAFERARVALIDAILADRRPEG